MNPRVSAHQLAENQIARAFLGQVDPWLMVEAFFASNPHAIQLYSVAGQSLFVNEAFRALFGSAPPPEYNVLQDEIVAERGLLPELRRAFAGERVQLPAFWYDPRELRQVKVDQGNRVYLRLSAFPLADAAGRVALVVFLFED